MNFLENWIEQEMKIKKDTYMNEYSSVLTLASETVNPGRNITQLALLDSFERKPYKIVSNIMK